MIMLPPLIVLSLVLPSGRVELEPGVVLLLPDATRPASGPAGVDLVLHLHGAAEIVEWARDEAGWNLPVLVFNRKGLSSVYAGPFSNPMFFSALLVRSAEALADARPGMTNIAFNHVLVSSFSAGFGGVRELLNSPAHVDRIAALVLADSLYCGYEADDPTKGLDDNKMAGFRVFAVEAAAYHNRMLISHSSQVPEGYGSTAETADDLIAVVGGMPTSAEEDWGDGWHLSRKFASGGLVVLGFDGDRPDDHMRHLRRLGLLWKQLPGLSGVTTTP